MENIITFLKSAGGTKLLIIGGVILVIILLTSLVKKLIPKYVENTDARYKSRKFVNFFSYALVVLAILITFSNQLTGLTVFIGVAGAGIAFALQEVIASIAGFIVIHTSNFYKVGDRVLLGGIRGDVIDIGFLRTSLMETGAWVDGDLYNGRMVRVANSFVFKEPVFNYSGDFPFLWDEIKIPIKTQGDFEWAEATFLKILDDVQGDFALAAKVDWQKLTETMRIEKAKVDPMVSMEFDENWITFTLRYVVDFKARRLTKDTIYKKVLLAIRNSNNKIEVASAAFEITAFPKQEKI